MSLSETLLDELARMKRDGIPIPDELLQLVKLQERLDTNGLSSSETHRYVKLCDTLGVLPAKYRYLLDQPLAPTTPS